MAAPRTNPEHFINRELSWLEFNQRVLDEGLNADVPLLERLKFLAIVSSNLDEFFMIRVAGLLQQRAAGIRQKDPSGLTPAQQLTAIGQRAHRMMADQAEGIRTVLGLLRKQGFDVVELADWTAAQRTFLQAHFTAELLPVLTPLAVQELTPAPLIGGLTLNLALLLRSPQDDKATERVVVVPVPRQATRFITLPSAEGLHVARLEDVIGAFAGAMFPGHEVVCGAVFRVTRDADTPIEDDDAADLLRTIEQALFDRRRRAAVRLEVQAKADARLRSWLFQWLDLQPDDVYDVPGLLDAAALMELASRPGFENLRYPDWPPQPPRDLAGTVDLWSAMQDRDALLFHPYESFDPVVRLLDAAADDPNVLAIKQTLYRTSGDSPIVQALERAATAGKQVVVLVELKARFDEARNVAWARRLEDAGCHVIYGLAGYKTHSKALLIVRREPGAIRRYVHLSTGNYNDRTARLYSDLGLLTCDVDVANDVAAFFNLLTGYSEAVGWSQLRIAPTGLRRRVLELIDREIQTSTADRPGLVMIKINSLQDPEMIEALYRASQAGVRVLLNVRGLCCLRPGVKGLSENICVTSIVDRYLEHARILYFRNGGHEETYLSSADLMHRNLDRRLEILFPVTDERLRRRLVGLLETYFADNVKARELQADGTYRPPTKGRKAVRAQEAFYRDAAEAAANAEHAPVTFRPLTRPET
jgi:polyphosphate kinase